MRRKSFRVGMAWRLLIALILALCLVPISSSQVVALSVDDYFEITYEPVEFSKTEIHGSEVFNATITVTATRNNNDFPLNLSPNEALITGRIIAEHQVTDAKVTLNSSYTVTINPFPQKGEITQSSVVVSLQFPEESQSGIYTVAGELIEAKIQVIIWWDVTSYLPSSQTMGSVTYVAPGGGGGGGGGGGMPPLTAEEVTTNLFGTEANFPISSSGEMLETIVATSEDGMLTLTIPEGIIALDEDGDPLSTLTVELDLDPPDPPAEAHIIGIPYKLGPPGTTFSPPMTIEFTVDPATLPPDVAVEDLVIAYYDETLVPPAWVELDYCVVDTENNTITASIEHFTTFAIIGVVIPPEPVEPEPGLAPAAFTPSSLRLSPVEVNIGDEVTINLLVANTGGKSGSYKVTLKIDGVVAATQEVTVSAGLSKEVTFAISKDIAGTYSVDVNGLTDSFTVKEEKEKEEEEAAAAAVITTPPTLPPADETSLPPPAKPINWPVVCGVVAALVAMGSLLFFLARRSHTKSSS